MKWECFTNNHSNNVISIFNRIRTIVGADANFLQAILRITFYACVSNPFKKVFQHLQPAKPEKEIFPSKDISDIKPFVYDEKCCVSIIIPSKNQATLLRLCLQSIKNNTTYDNYEVIVINNGSTESDFLKLIENAKSMFNSFICIDAAGPFNFSTLINIGYKHSNGDYLILLNNDTEVLSGTWINEMLAYGMNDKVGAVGCKLLYPDLTIQHSGIKIYADGKTVHAYAGMNRNHPEANQLKSYPAITAAAMLVSKKKFEMVGGFDELFAVDFNDIDFCLRLQKAGLVNLYIPQVELIHHESVSRRHPLSHPVKYKAFKAESSLFMKRWINTYHDTAF
jgi:GT2 family glycosyltransferase